ncbi:hypothetical protein PSPO01_01813 [Paraphaeosphaeria sporulosa]
MGVGDGRGPRDSSHKATVVEIRPPPSTALSHTSGAPPGTTEDTLASGCQPPRSFSSVCLEDRCCAHGLFALATQQTPLRQPPSSQDIQDVNINVVYPSARIYSLFPSTASDSCRALIGRPRECELSADPQGREGYKCERNAMRIAPT